MRDCMKNALHVILFATAAAAPMVAQATEVQRVVLPHATEPEKQVEYFWHAPEGEGPWPVLLFVHGHQSGRERPGAKAYVDRGYLRRAAADGMLACAVSMSGYGASDGPPDFCGPRTQGAVATVLQHLRERDDVRATRIVLYGYSRGAAVAGMVAATDPKLAGVILGAGIYDVAAGLRSLGDSEREARMRTNVLTESGGTEAAFRERSVLHAEPTIRVPTLILHGEDDSNCPVQQARDLAERLRAAGTPVTLKVFAGVGHGIPSAKSRPFTDAFLADRARTDPAEEPRPTSAGP